MRAYLASPYSHPDEEVREQRAKNISRVAGTLMCHGFKIFCPIAHSHMIQTNTEGLDCTEWHFWREHDIDQLKDCDELWIVMLEGWLKSVGIKGEIKYAMKNNMPIKLITPCGFVINDITYGALLQMLETTFEELND